MKFDELEISDKLKKSLSEGKFVELTEVQKQCIPPILEGKDVVGQGETGSGKTLAFVLPLLEKIFVGGGVQVLVLTPTRELCVQVADVFDHFGKVLGVRTLSVFGGVGITAQLKKIRKVEVVVATPGRLLDILGRKVVDFSDFEFLVVDETDKMFEMGFIDDVKRIIRSIPGKRQTLMFSATISAQVQRLMDKYLEEPLVVRTKALVDTSKLNQSFFDMSNEVHKFSLLTHLLKEQSSGLAIVFCATRVKTDVVCRNLRNHKVKAAAIHGGMSQNERLRTLDALKRKRLKVLVATDVAARGLDIKDVTHIYNYDVPPTTVDYVHRIGRTARAGEQGSAVTLLTRKDYEKFARIDNDEDLVIKKSVAPQYPQVEFDRNLVDDGRRGGGGRNKRGGGGQSKRHERSRSPNKSHGGAHQKDSFNQKNFERKNTNHGSGQKKGSSGPSKRYEKSNSSKRSYGSSHQKDSFNQKNFERKNTNHGSGQSKNSSGSSKKYYESAHQKTPFKVKNKDGASPVVSSGDGPYRKKSGYSSQSRKKKQNFQNKSQYSKKYSSMKKSDSFQKKKPYSKSKNYSGRKTSK